MHKHTKKIFVFENNHDMLRDIQQQIKLEKITLIKCDRIRAANENWKKHRAEISGIILDLMMPTTGFTPEQRAKSNDGYSTGWVWFMDNVVNGNFARADIIKRTLLFSDFLSDLESNIPSEEKELLKTVHKIGKGEKSRWKQLQSFVKNL